ncbi:hypothetical protein ACLKA6_010919 [Drosophila palustris]
MASGRQRQRRSRRRSQRRAVCAACVVVSWLHANEAVSLNSLHSGVGDSAASVGGVGSVAMRIAFSAPIDSSNEPAKAAKIKFSKQNQHHAYRHTDNLYDGGTDTDDDECPLESTTMNPYEYESTLDCRDAGGGPSCPGTLPMTGRHMSVAAGGLGGGGGAGPGVHSQTLQHQNQQNLQAAAAAAAAQQSSVYDYEYQHLPHRPPDTTANSTAQRTHGRQVISLAESGLLLLLEDLILTCRISTYNGRRIKLQAEGGRLRRGQKQGQKLVLLSGRILCISYNVMYNLPETLPTLVEPSLMKGPKCPASV